MHLGAYQRLVFVVPAAMLWLAASEPAYSCAVCFSANDKSREAYLFTTGLLSAMPLLIIVSIAYWFKCRCARLNAVHPQLDN